MIEPRIIVERDFGVVVEPFVDCGLRFRTDKMIGRRDVEHQRPRDSVAFAQRLIDHDPVVIADRCVKKAGFRILNTDNYPATLNGSSVGASNANELRVAVYIFTDHKLRVQVNHETGIKETRYTAPTILPTGEHTLELAGDVANAAPWYLKVDGVVVASGVKRLSTDDMVDSERVITRIVAGIDGAREPGHEFNESVGKKPGICQL